MYVYYIHVWYPQRTEEGLGSPGTGTTGGFGKLEQELQVLLTPALSLQPLIESFKDSGAFKGWTVYYIVIILNKTRQEKLWFNVFVCQANKALVFAGQFFVLFCPALASSRKMESQLRYCLSQLGLQAHVCRAFSLSLIDVHGLSPLQVMPALSRC